MYSIRRSDLSIPFLSFFKKQTMGEALFFISFIENGDTTQKWKCNFQHENHYNWENIL